MPERGFEVFPASTCFYMFLRASILTFRTMLGLRHRTAPRSLQWTFGDVRFSAARREGLRAWLTQHQLDAPRHSGTQIAHQFALQVDPNPLDRFLHTPLDRDVA